MIGTVFIIKTSPHGNVPCGLIEEWAGEAVPVGWALADGSEYDPDALPELDAVLQHLAGPGWFARTFLRRKPDHRLPDLRVRLVSTKARP